MKKQSAVAEAGAATIAVLESPIRPMGKLEKLFQYDGKNNVTLVKDSKLTAAELVAFLSERIVNWGSESIRIANTLRLARMLPPVKEGEREIEAFKWAIEKLKANAATGPTFTNIAYLVPAIDLVEINGLNVSPFAAKNALGWLKEKGVIDEKTMKLDPVKAVSDPVVGKLKAGIGASKLSTEIRELRKPAASSNGGGNTGGEDTPAKVALDLRVMLTRIEKLNVALGVDKVRSEIAGSVKEVAKLAGFDCVPLPAPAVTK